MILDKKEKQVILYLVEMCPQKRSYLILAEQIAEFISKKYLITIDELDEIMFGLSKDNFIDFVATDSKNGYYYCITLKGKALTLKKDLKKQKQELIWTFVRTVGLGVLSFVIGVLLKTIFKG